MIANRIFLIAAGALSLVACEDLDTLAFTGPAEIDCGDDETYEIKATMDESKAFVQQVYFVHVDEDDTWGDDILIDATAVGIIRIPAGTNVGTKDVVLGCTVNCILGGASGQSEYEKPYQVHAEADGTSFLFFGDIKSANQEIKCIGDLSPDEF